MHEAAQENEKGRVEQVRKRERNLPFFWEINLDVARLKLELDFLPHKWYTLSVKRESKHNRS